MTKRILIVTLLSGLVVLASACAGPDNRDDTDPTPTTVAQPTIPTQVALNTATTTTEPSPTAAATATTEATPIATSTETPEPPTPTPEPTPTATAIPISLAESLPQTDELPGEGFFLANQGARSALDLANSYADATAHLERLNEWGFKEHLFREYSRESQGNDDTVPFYVLTTVNEYGGDEQAADALDWLRSLNASQGQEFVEPDPELADGAFASSVLASDGTRTAIVYVRVGPRIYAYFAQGGEPLAFALELAESNTKKIAATN